MINYPVSSPSRSPGEKTGRTKGEPADKWFSTWGGCVTSSQWQRLEMLLNILQCTSQSSTTKYYWVPKRQ